MVTAKTPAPIAMVSTTRPAAIAMSREIASHRMAHRHGGAEPDQDGVNSTTQPLRKVAMTSTDPKHIQAGTAERESGQHEYAPIPAMKCGKAVADLRNKLERSGEDYDDGRENMHGNGEIAHGRARNVPMRHESIPRLEIPPSGRTTVETR